MTKLEPIHPGEILKYDFMEPIGLSAVTLSTETGVPIRHIDEIACGNREISAETARRFTEYFGTDSQSWMNLQSHYNDAIAKREQVHSIAFKIAGFLWPFRKPYAG